MLMKQDIEKYVDKIQDEIEKKDKKKVKNSYGKFVQLFPYYLRPFIPLILMILLFIIYMLAEASLSPVFS